MESFLGASPICVITYHNFEEWQVLVEELTSLGYQFRVTAATRIDDYAKSNTAMIIHERNKRLLFTDPDKCPFGTKHGTMEVFTQHLRDKLIKNLENEENNKQIEADLLQSLGPKTFMGKGPN